MPAFIVAFSCGTAAIGTTKVINHRIMWDRLGTKDGIATGALYTEPNKWWTYQRMLLLLEWFHGFHGTRKHDAARNDWHAESQNITKPFSFFLRAVVTMVGRSDLVFLVCGFHHQLFLLINPTCEVCCKPKKMENYKKKQVWVKAHIYIYTLYTRVIKRHVRKDIKIDIESRGDGEGRRRRRRRRRSKATPEDQNTRTPNIRTPQHAKHENANAITPLTPEHHQHQKTRTPKHHEARMPRQ